MAIKGKGKTRGGRPGTNAPRPTIVVPKRPILARPSTRWLTLGLLLTVVAVILLVAWNKQQDQKAIERQGLAIDQMKARVDLGTQSVTQRGAGTSFAIAPDFTAQAAAFAAATKPADIAKQSADLKKQVAALPKLLEGAAKQVDGIAIPDDLRNTRFTSELVDAKSFMVEGFKAYDIGVAMVASAIDADGKLRKDLLTEAAVQFALAGRLYDNGHQILVNVQTALGTFRATEFNNGFPTPTA